MSKVQKVDEFSYDKESGQITIWHSGTSEVRGVDAWIAFNKHRGWPSFATREAAERDLESATQYHNFFCALLAQMLSDEGKAPAKPTPPVTDYDDLIAEWLAPTVEDVAPERVLPPGVDEDSAMSHYYEQHLRREQEHPYDAEEAHYYAH